MPTDIQPPDEGQSILAWLAQNGGRSAVIAAFKLLAKLRGIRVTFVTPGSAPDRGVTPIEAGDNIELPLPLKFSTTLGDAAAYPAAAANGTYLQAEITALKSQVAELTTKHNALLAQLRLTGQNPQ